MKVGNNLLDGTDQQAIREQVYIHIVEVMYLTIQTLTKIPPILYKSKLTCKLFLETFQNVLHLHVV